MIVFLRCNSRTHNTKLEISFFQYKALLHKLNLNKYLLKLIIFGIESESIIRCINGFDKFELDGFKRLK